MRTVVGKFCEAEAFWPASFAIINESKVQNPPSTAENLCDLFFGQACTNMLATFRWRTSIPCRLTIGDVPHEHDAGWLSGRHCDSWAVALRAPSV